MSDYKFLPNKQVKQTRNQNQVNGLIGAYLLRFYHRKIFFLYFMLHFKLFTNICQHLHLHLPLHINQNIHINNDKALLHIVNGTFQQDLLNSKIKSWFFFQISF